MIKLKMPDGRIWNSDGFLEPSLKDVYQKKLLDYYNKNAGIEPIEKYRISIQAIKNEYKQLLEKENENTRST